MIVSVVSMPDGVVARTGLAQARERLAATSGIVIVDIDPGDGPPLDEEPLSRRLGLDDAPGEWLGRADEHVRAEYHDGTATGVVPVVSRTAVTHIEALRDAARRAATSYASLVADQQNVVINRLTIVSMIFLPLSFLTGFFGMNFACLTNRLTSEDSFLEFGVGLQVGAVVVALYYVLYRTHWRQLRDSRIRDAADDQS
ncbi:CorA family divalent cation transporter [Streptomyces mirabilis]|uniref:CorA family divalent cation transporter n=1 Tax=Streptomyces mirabilis TaxID=68239 RepID=UPI0036424CA8